MEFLSRRDRNSSTDVGLSMVTPRCESPFSRFVRQTGNRFSSRTTMLYCTFKIVNREWAICVGVRQDVHVPKQVELRVSTPPDVHAATQAFGSELRLHLIRHFAHAPGRQVDAVRELGVERAVVSLNVRVLLDAGVLIAEGTQRSRTFRVDHVRLGHLVAVVQSFTKG
jgi:hypothetical protein